MSKKVAIVGSELEKSHGGVVITGSPTATWNGIPIARVGDEVICSKHGKNKIKTAGSTIYTVDGQPAAIIDSVCECGAKIEKSDSLILVSS